MIETGSGRTYVSTKRVMARIFACFPTAPLEVLIVASLRRRTSLPHEHEVPMLILSTERREILRDTISAMSEALVEGADVRPPPVLLLVRQTIPSVPRSATDPTDAVVGERIPERDEFFTEDPLKRFGALCVAALSVDQVLTYLRFSRNSLRPKDHPVLKRIDDGGPTVVKMKEHLRLKPVRLLQKAETALDIVEHHLPVSETRKTVQAHCVLRGCGVPIES
ncbi:MAG: hypothetical protein Q8P56_00410 [Candidatus Uhrbacteria bacterium]|nr:hypothetical protein [Candidatus Uhrbacteria bacterium]